MRNQKSIPHNPFRWALYASRPYSPWVVVAIIASAVAQAAGTSISYIFKGVIDATNAYASGNGTFHSLMLWVIAYPILVFVEQILWRTSGFTGMRWVTGFRKRSFELLFSYLSAHSRAFFAKRFAGALTSAISNVSQSTGRMMEAFLWNYVPTVVAALVTIGLATYASPLLGAVFAGWMFVVAVVNVLLAKRLTALSEASAADLSKLRGTTVDIISNIAAVHSFARIQNENQNIAEAAERQRRLSLKSWIASEFLLLFNNLLLGGFVASVMGVAFYLWLHGGITVGTLVMSLTLAANVIWVITFIGTSLNGLAADYGETRNGLNDIIVPHEIEDAPDAKPLVVSKGGIAFNGVSFAYEDRRVLNNLSLIIAPGERVGIVGPSGAGKTTTIGLLMHQHDIPEGSITIDGQDIASVTQESLQNAIATVPQESLLFHRSIRENIRYGRLSATDAEIEEAARKAEAHGFIATLKDGYDTIVGERGVKLSGGERQRIAIARAVLKNAPILILDEATSSLDSESESAIQEALRQLMKGKTVLAIAHRLSTIRAMDRIVVIENGAVAEDGTHETLLQKKGVYARLWEHQAGGFLSDEDVTDVTEEW